MSCLLDRWHWALLLICLCFGSYFGLRASTDTGRAVRPGPVASATAPTQPQTKNIEDIRVGDRVIGRNPIREQAEEIEPDPTTWRKISLHMHKQGGSSLWIELLRPAGWVEAYDAQPGITVYLDLPEMGAVGAAEVTSLGPCPEIQPGEGTVVTGTFKHQADRNSHVGYLKFEGQTEPTGVTNNHAYWSVDRQQFVAAGHLHPGELVDTSSGPRRVVSFEPIEYIGYRHNLETTEHVYRAGALGTLVHNECAMERYVSKLEAERSLLKKGLHVDPKINGKFKNVADVGTFNPKTLGLKNATRFSHKLTLELRDGAREWLRKQGVEPPLGHKANTWEIPAKLVDTFNTLFVKGVKVTQR